MQASNLIMADLVLPQSHLSYQSQQIDTTIGINPSQFFIADSHALPCCEMICA